MSQITNRIYRKANSISRRMGSKGLMSLSNSARSFSRSRRWSQWSPLVLFSGLVIRLKPTRRNPGRDSQSSELLEWKRHMEQADCRNTAAWSVTGNSAAKPDNGEKHLGVQLTEKRAPGNSTPEIISSLALSSKPAARLSAGEPGPVDYVPPVERRVSRHYRSAEQLSALQSFPVEPVKLGSTPDLGRHASPRRDSQGEPLSPSAWMADLGLASGSHVDPFANPSYISSSGDHHDSVQSTSRISDPRNSMCNAPSSGSDRTPRGRQTSPHRYNNDRPSAVVKPSDVSPDGASDIISTFGSAFGDRPSSHRTVSTIDDDRYLSATQLVRHGRFSDVEVRLLRFLYFDAF
jgi:hypothetical protein